MSSNPIHIYEEAQPKPFFQFQSLRFINFAYNSPYLMLNYLNGAIIWAGSFLIENWLIKMEEDICVDWMYLNIHWKWDFYSVE